MSKKDPVTIYTTPSFRIDFEIDTLNKSVIALPVQQMVKRFMEEGKELDICIMPFVSQYRSLLSTFRARELFGPVFFVSNEPVDTSIIYDIHKYGAFLVDIRNQQKDFLKLILIFIIENQKLTKKEKTVRPPSPQEIAAAAIQKMYPQKIPEPVKKTEQPDVSDTKKMQSVLAEVLEQPAVLSFDEIYHNKDLFDAIFSFSLTVTRKKDTRKLTFSCLAKLNSINPISTATKKQMMFFADFQPDFSIKFFRRILAQVTKEDVAHAVKTKPDDYESRHKVECMFSLDNVNRICTLLPAVKKNDETIGFIPVSEALINNRQFFRVEPSKEIPLEVFVGSTLCITQYVEVIDISERGISFYSEFMFSKHSEISLFLTWSKRKLACIGIVRFIINDEETGKNMVGVELFLHEDERAKLRKYIFECQIEIMKTLREEYSV